MLGFLTIGGPFSFCKSDFPCSFPCYQGICTGEGFAADCQHSHSHKIHIKRALPQPISRTLVHVSSTREWYRWERYRPATYSTVDRALWEHVKGGREEPERGMMRDGRLGAACGLLASMCLLISASQALAEKPYHHESNAEVYTERGEVIRCGEPSFRENQNVREEARRSTSHALSFPMTGSS
jgi:hypothetical protein